MTEQLSWRAKLTQVVEEMGPIRSTDAIARVLPNADRKHTTMLAGCLANLARDGKIERIAPGLYDRREN